MNTNFNYETHSTALSLLHPFAPKITFGSTLSTGPYLLQKLGVPLLAHRFLKLEPVLLRNKYPSPLTIRRRFSERREWLRGAGIAFRSCIKQPKFVMLWWPFAIKIVKIWGEIKYHGFESRYACRLEFRLRFVDDLNPNPAFRVGSVSFRIRCGCNLPFTITHLVDLLSGFLYAVYREWHGFVLN
jgi:hypothetical protein